MLNIIGTIDRPTSGRVSLFGRDIDYASVSDDELAALRLQRIGFVFQTFNLLSTLSAFENVELPMSILGCVASPALLLRAADARACACGSELSKRQCKERAQRLLTAVGLEDRMMHLPSELSGGEQQRCVGGHPRSPRPRAFQLTCPQRDHCSRAGERARAAAAGRAYG